VTASTVREVEVTVDLSEAAVVDIDLAGPFSDAEYTDEEGPEPSDADSAPDGH
jgi:hypothetical protein